MVNGMVLVYEKWRSVNKACLSYNVSDIRQKSDNFWERHPYRISTKPANCFTLCLKMSVFVLILTSILFDQYDRKLERSVERI